MNKDVLYVLLLFYLSFSSCQKEKKYVAYKLTEAERKWIEYADMTPTYAVYDFDTLKSISNKDSIVIHKTKEITIQVESQTGIYRGESESEVYEYETGSAEFPFFPFLGVHSIYVSKDNTTPFRVDIGFSNDFGPRFQIEPNLANDTEKVGEKVYEKVLKLDFKEADIRYKNVLFAKTVGFIKIELKDGRKIELK